MCFSIYFTFFTAVILTNSFWSKIEHSIPLLSLGNTIIPKIQGTRQNLVTLPRGLSTVVSRWNNCQDLNQVLFCHDEYSCIKWNNNIKTNTIWVICLFLQMTVEPNLSHLIPQKLDFHLYIIRRFTTFQSHWSLLNNEENFLLYI